MFRTLVAISSTEMLLHAVASGSAPLCAGDNVSFLDGTSTVVEVDIDGTHIEKGCRQRVGEESGKEAWEEECLG